MTMIERIKRRKADEANIWPNHEQTVGDPTAGCIAIGSAPLRTPVRLSGRIRSVRVQPQTGIHTVTAKITDDRNELVVVFLGRRRIPGIDVGRSIVVEGVISVQGEERRMLNPRYQLL
jgi:hypothetical protein